jgi:hypothetical protein
MVGRGFTCAALLAQQLVVASAWSAEESEPPLFAIANSQESPGLTELDLTPSFVKQLEHWAVALLRDKLALAPSGQNSKKADELKIIADSMLLIVEGKRLAVIQTTLGDRVREVSVMGFRNGEFYRVGCVRESDHEISVFFGKCGKVVSETFGIEPIRSSDPSRIPQ